MAAISIAINNGTEGFKISDFTVGTSAPTASTDFEFRFNTTDQNSHAVTIKQAILAIDAIKRALESNSKIITPPTI